MAAAVNPNHYIPPSSLPTYSAALDAMGSPYDAMTHPAVKAEYLSKLWATYSPEDQARILDHYANPPAAGSFANTTNINGTSNVGGNSVQSYLTNQYALLLGRLPTSEEVKWYEDAWKQGAFADPNNPGMGSADAIAKFIQGQPEAAQYQASGVKSTDPRVMLRADMADGSLMDGNEQPVDRWAMGAELRAQNRATGAGQATRDLGFGGRGGGDPLERYSPNPYLETMSNTVLGQLNDNFSRNVLPQINSSAIAAGQYGSSRQGVVQANAMNDLAKQGANAITGMYYGDFNNAMNRNLQRYGIDTNAQTAKDQLGLGYASLDANVANMNNDNSLAWANYGLNVMNSANAWNNSALNAGNAVQNTPYQYWNNFTGAAGSMGNAGATSWQQYYSSPVTSAAGGAYAGSKVGSSLGF